MWWWWWWCDAKKGCCAYNKAHKTARALIKTASPKPFKTHHSKISNIIKAFENSLIILVYVINLQKKKACEFCAVVLNKNNIQLYPFLYP